MNNDFLFLLNGHHPNDAFYFDKVENDRVNKIGSDNLANMVQSRIGQNDADDFKAKYLREQLLG